MHMSLSSPALAVILGIVAPGTALAETVPDPPSATQSSAIASPPLPTVLRGSPPPIARPVPVCPPSYTVAPDYGCLPPAAGDYSGGWPEYDYWPSWGWGYGYGWFPGFGGSHGFTRFPHFRGFHGFVGFHGFTRFHSFRGFHGFAGFHGSRFPGFGVGHMGGLGRR